MHFLYALAWLTLPDVCPEELEKMAVIVDECAKRGLGDDAITPIFVSCDPKRDSVASIKSYLKGKCVKYVSHRQNSTQSSWG